jgi:cell division protein FtsW
MTDWSIQGTRTAVRRPARVPVVAERRRRRFALPGEATGNYYLLLSVVVVITMIGLIMVLSSSAVKSLDEGGSTWSYFEKQVVWCAFGTVALVGLMAFGHRVRRLSFFAWVVSVVLLMAVLVVGVTVNGAKRWLAAGGMQLQPSELAKLTMILFVAHLVDRRQKHLDDQRLAARCVVRPVMLALGVVAGLIMLEPNLGTTLVIVAITASMLFAAGAPGRSVGKWLALFLSGAVLAVARTPWRLNRLMAFRDPWAHSDGSGFQTLQSQSAAAGGGLLGRGLGDSRAKWNYLPEAHTDFIYAVMAEEFGLVGGVLMILLFLAIAVLGARIAMKAEGTFDQLVAVGVTAWFVVQAFINIGAVVGVLPITGVPLPFVSFGGSSLLFTMAGAGLLLGVARRPAAGSASTR